MKIIPWNQDKWLSREGSVLPYDKLEHLILALLGVMGGVLVLKISLPVTMIFIAALGLAWEIKDGFYSHGFSGKDFLADIAGIAVGYALVQWF